MWSRGNVILQWSPDTLLSPRDSNGYGTQLPLVLAFGFTKYSYRYRYGPQVNQNVGIEHLTGSQMLDKRYCNRIALMAGFAISSLVICKLLACQEWLGGIVNLSPHWCYVLSTRVKWVYSDAVVQYSRIERMSHQCAVLSSTSPLHIWSRTHNSMFHLTL